MSKSQHNIENYLNYCQYQKRLDSKTIKAYRIDLQQFLKDCNLDMIEKITPTQLETYIYQLHQKYKPKTVKRKIASIKALFHYFQYRDIIDSNPFDKLQIKFREPVILPKNIPLHTMETLLFTVYDHQKKANTEYQKTNALRDTAIIELLFATGIRISELCSLKINDLNLYDGTILIHGKGYKQRKVQIGNNDVAHILREYDITFSSMRNENVHFFVNQNGTTVSDQAVRRMINKYTSLASIELHITPHMFRHTFATSLLEADVDIRYIQEMLGHSSINVTEIYTHVAMSKQKDILTNKHPRRNFQI